MVRLVWFLPALGTLVVAGALGVMGAHDRSLRVVALALLGLSLWLAREAQKRAPPPRRAVSQSVLVAVVVGGGLAVAMIGIVLTSILATR
jgi:positive regulator of sigma E activity